MSSKSAKWFLERRFLKILTIYGHGSHLGNVTCKMLMNFFNNLYLQAYIQNLVENGPVVSEKNKVQSSSINDIGPRSRNDLDLQYSHIFIKSISLRSQAAIVSE